MKKNRLNPVVEFEDRMISGLEKVIKQYHVKAVVVKTDNGYYACNSIPEKLPQSVKDYIRCHYNIVDEDYYSALFTF